MRVQLRHSTPLFEAVNGARTCYDSHHLSDSMGPKDEGLVSGLIDESVIEHVNYTYHIFGPSRATLQEVARHRIASLSVESSRYVWKRLKKMTAEELDNMTVKTHPMLDEIERQYIAKLVDAIIEHKIKPDIFKHKFPESMKTNFVMTINARSLRNFFKLRLPRRAMWEIRKLAVLMWEQLPQQDMDCLFGDLRSLYEQAAQDIIEHSTQALGEGTDQPLP